MWNTSAQPLVFDFEFDYSAFITMFFILATGIFMFVNGLVWWYKKRMIQNIPRSNIRGIAMGLVEIHGKVTRTESEGGKFSKNYPAYTQMNVLGWGQQRRRFYVKDKTGEVLIGPKGASFEINPAMQFGSKGKMSLNVGDEVYVMGVAQDNPDVEDTTSKYGLGDVMIARGKGPFIISSFPSKELIKQHETGMLSGLAIGGSAIFMSVAYLVMFFVYYWVW